MTTWYVRKTGSDSNGGSSASATPDQSGSDGTITSGTTTFTSASATFAAGDVGKGINIGGVLYRVSARSSNTSITLDRNYTGSTTTTGAWRLGGALLTINKATALGGVNSVVFGGEIIYVGAGTYREFLSPVSYSSQGTGPTLAGDVDGSHTGDPGEVRVSAYDTNDRTLPSNNTLITTAPYWSFQNLVFINGIGQMLSSPNVNNSSFSDCTFFGAFSASTWAITRTTQSAANVHFFRCILFLPRGTMSHTLTTFSTGSDYDAQMSYESCVIVCPSFTVSASGALAKLGGGVRLLNCLLISTGASSGTAFVVVNSSTSATFPCRVENSVVLAGNGGVALSGGATTLIEDYNWINGTRSGVTAGTHSISDGSVMPLFSVGQESQFGAAARPFGMPAAASALLGFGNGSNAVSTDLLGINPRPAGGGSASKTLGPYERGNTFIRETGTVHTGSNGLKCVGPGYQDFLVPVTAATTVSVSVYLRYDSTYAGTRPQLLVRNGGEIGVVNASSTATVAALNAWEKRTLTLTPTGNGLVTLRIVSSDTNGGGAVYADTFEVA